MKTIEQPARAVGLRTSLPRQETITIPVLGMSCAACQSHVERTLRATPGVGGAEVNLIAQTAKVVFDPMIATPANLVEAVKGSGYDSSLPASAEAPPHSSDPRVEHEHSIGGEGGLRLRAFAALGMAAAAMFLSMPLMKQMGQAAGILERLAMPLPPALYDVPPQIFEIILLSLTLIGMGLAWREVYQPAWRAALHRTTNMNTLVTLGTIAALLYSGLATFMPLLFIHNGLLPGVYYESVLFILGFSMLGRWLEGRAKLRTQGALQAFMELQPETATVLREGQEIKTPLASVQIGDTVVLRPGERIPVDGVILAGITSVDESLVTGESLPAARGPGDRLIGGSLNHDGAIEYRATSVGNSGTLGQMLRLMQAAQSSRAPTQVLADRASAVFVPVVLGLALATLLLWLAWNNGAVPQAFSAAITVLVIACPCAMGLAVPAALTVAIGRGAELGILFKSGEALERLARIDTVVLDKTGTLTEGKPRIESFHVEDGIDGRELLTLAASLELRSEHPLAKAVLHRAAEAGIALLEAANVRAAPGKGIVGTVAGKEVAAGNSALFVELGIAMPILPKPAEESQAAVSSVLLIAIDRKYCGYLAAQDEVRSGAAETIAALRTRGLRAIMLTGDHPGSAKAVAERTGMDEVHAELLPEQKLEYVRAVQRSGKIVAMVGDGINDAAAMAQADTGIAMGTGTDLAREAGDAVLLRARPLSIVAAIDLARATRKTMRANLAWAVAYNALGIPIAAGALYPLLGILLSPAIASAAMALSSVSVLVNSLRLRRFQAHD